MVAKYQQVMGQLSTEIEQMQAGARLPTELELAERFGVSAMTMRRALQALSDAKRIVGIRGRGTFVAPSTVRKTMTLTSFTESMRSIGMVASTRLISASVSPADEVAAEYLGIEVGAPHYTLRRLRLGDGIPLCVDMNYLPADDYPGLLGEDLTGSLYALLHRRYGVVLQRARSRITAVLPDASDADLLEIDSAQPCVRVRSSTTSADHPDRTMETSVSTYRGDRYELFVDATDGTA